MWSCACVVLRINNVESGGGGGVHEAEGRSNVRQAKCKSKGQWGVLFLFYFLFFSAGFDTGRPTARGAKGGISLLLFMLLFK